MGGEGRYTDLLEDIVFLFLPSSFFRHNELCMLMKYRLCNDRRMWCRLVCVCSRESDSS